MIVRENANLWPGPNAAKLVLSFEVLKVDDSILTARICEGGKYEIGFGNTYYEDGSRVKAGDKITMERAYAMRAMALRKEWMPVQAALAFVPNQNQIDALAVAAYNLGGGTVAKADAIVGQANANRWEDAAAGFSEYIGARSPGPSEREITNGWVPKGIQWARIDGKPRWLDANGQPCLYFRRMRGLLRRRHAEACLFLGYQWETATEDDRIAISTERFWNERRGWWEDKVREKTEFSSIYAIARNYPLANVPIAAEPDPPVAAPTVPVEVEALPEIKPEPPAKPPVEVLPPPPIPTKEKPVSPPKLPQPTLPNDFDPNAGAKAMVYSRRFWGWVLIILGRFSFFSDGSAGLLAQTGGTVGAVANGIAADPLLLDAYTGFAVMITGEAVRWWGEKKAKKVLV